MEIEGINVSSVPVIEKHIFTHYSQLLNPVQQGQHNISLSQFIHKHNIEIPRISNSDKVDMSKNLAELDKFSFRAGGMMKSHFLFLDYVLQI